MANMTTTQAEIIINQMGGWRRIRAMLGRKTSVLLGQDEAGNPQMTLKFSNPDRRRPNIFKVALNCMDLYLVEFGRVKRYDYVKGAEFTHGLYADGLKDCFEDQTGLYLSL